MEEPISHIDYRFTSRTFECEEKYLFEIQGDIYNHEEFDEDTLIGKIKYYILNVEESDIHADDLLDIYSNTAAFIGNFYNKSGHTLKRKIKKLIGYEILNINILILDRIEILPKFRGKKLTSEIIEDGIRHFGKNISLLALKSFPLQFEYQNTYSEISLWQKDMQLDSLNKDEKNAFLHLNQYYKSLGFTKLNDDNIMVKIIE
ncbi:TPA: hypothetical protein ACKRMM_005935 [Pseudomonas aeruginosa]